MVRYSGPHGPGTIVIDTPRKFLYLVQPGGVAIRYGIGVGRPGFSWAGVKTVSMKREWPDWRPRPRCSGAGPTCPATCPAASTIRSVRGRFISAHPLPYPRHQRAAYDWPRGLLGLHPDAERGRGGSLRARQSRDPGGGDLSRVLGSGSWGVGRAASSSSCGEWVVGAALRGSSHAPRPTPHALLPTPYAQSPPSPPSPPKSSSGAARARRPGRASP